MLMFLMALVEKLVCAPAPFQSPLKRIKYLSYLFLCVFFSTNSATAEPGLQTRNFPYCYIFIHYSYIFVLFSSFLQFPSLKMNYLLICFLSKDGNLKKLRKSMNNVWKYMKITIMKVSSLEPFLVKNRFVETQ